MRYENLTSPGLLSKAFQLRRMAAQAISAAEIAAKFSPSGKTVQAKKLYDFFASCVTAMSGLYDVTVPTISSRVATSSTLVTLTFSETMDRTVVPAAAAFTSAGNTIGARTWTSATTLTVAGTGFASGENFTYTVPATNYLRDAAGNAVATTSANLT